MEEDDNVIDDNFSSDEDNESSSNSSRDGEGGIPHQWATPPQYVALRAHTTQGPAPGVDDEQTQHGHDITRSGQRSFRDTLYNPFGYPDSVLDIPLMSPVFFGFSSCTTRTNSASLTGDRTMDETSPVNESSRVLFPLKHGSGSATVKKKLLN
ncbi:hypothetical protein J6590_064172 [Homalodisca vitripennis]|nr:hypothetical protein J6590_064172 [Homalodisca vitripennis]